MLDRPLVSTIVPVYNRASLIRTCLESVFRQEHRPIELIVVDDGSTDGTGEVATAWTADRLAPEFNVRILRQDNAGVSAARNRGLAESRGEYIQFLDSDDLLLPHKLSRQVKELDARKADYVYGVSPFVGPDGIEQVRTPGREYHARPWPKEYVSRSIWVVNSVLYRREVCAAVGPWCEDLIGDEDQEYAARVKVSNFRGVFLDEVFDIVRRDHAFGQATIQRTPEQTLRYVRSVDLALARIAQHLQGTTFDTLPERLYLARRIAGNAARYANIGQRIAACRSFLAAGRVAPSFRHRCGFAGLAISQLCLPSNLVLRLKRAVGNAFARDTLTSRGELEC